MTNPGYDRRQMVILPYIIHSFSSYCEPYHPDHILVDDPQDAKSRWTSQTNDNDQFIILSLTMPESQPFALFQMIEFGKFHLPHVCNLKLFDLYDSIDGIHWRKALIHANLSNSGESEFFPVHAGSPQSSLNSSSQIDFSFLNAPPSVKFIKIIPKLTWGSSFNFGIWFIRLYGISDPTLVQQAHALYLKKLEWLSLRSVLKFCKNSYPLSFQALSKESGISLQSSIVTDLQDRCRALQSKESYEELEAFLLKAYESGCMSECYQQLPWIATWTELESTNSKPSPRGGHAMVCDESTGYLYLFGGYNGSEDLNDLWQFQPDTLQWTFLGPLTSFQSDHSWPSPRSVHKMVIDPSSRKIYMLGRFVDDKITSHLGHFDSTPTLSDFWSFDISSSVWTCLSLNTHQDHGPSLLYDTQMVIDSTLHKLFCFGGKLVPPSSLISNSTDPAYSSMDVHSSYSGLFEYDLVTKQWNSLRSCPDSTIGPKLKGRIGHCLLLDESLHRLIIFGGQRHQDLVSDFLVYDILTDTLSVYIPNLTLQCQALGVSTMPPHASFSHRAVMSCGDLVVLGISDSKEPHQFVLWTCHPTLPSSGIDVQDDYYSTWKRLLVSNAPVPRFAHQLVIDHKRHCLYLFGGNSGDLSTSCSHPRLADLHKLTLERPSSTRFFKKVQLLCRQACLESQLETLAKDPSTFALNISSCLTYLQTQLAPLVESEPTEAIFTNKDKEQFQSLPQLLFSTPEEILARKPTSLYQNILPFMNVSLRAPLQDLSTLF